MENKMCPLQVAHNLPRPWFKTQLQFQFLSSCHFSDRTTALDIFFLKLNITESLKIAY